MTPLRMFVLCTLAARGAMAQGLHCTKPESQGIAFLSTSAYTTTGGFGARGEQISYGQGARFTRYQVGSYTEYGYSDNITLVTNSSVVRLESTSGGVRRVNTGLGNPELGVQFAIEKIPGIGSFFCAFATTVKLPMRSGGDPVIGFRQTDVEGSLRSLGGYELRGKSGYWVTDIGYRHRFAEPADEVRVNALAAYRVARNWYYVAQALTTTGMRDGSPIPVGSNLVLDPNYSSYSFQTSAMFRSSRTRWIQVGGARELAGRNSGRGSTISLVLWQYF